ncbi:hypothetical protein BpHYR1_036989 [Brachionus plicatilis]|uniref:Uncharacterized protein n=1 Tax=Brachionus plicatilis TaxID=10195 RepID=A0A3M7SXR3_BRAPC|nr:hypothetical protein BpHYR1_036989 [Brachionus plicatilis]
MTFEVKLTHAYSSTLIMSTKLQVFVLTEKKHRINNVGIRANCKKNKFFQKQLLDMSCQTKKFTRSIILIHNMSSNF